MLKRVARSSSYEGRLLIEEFKREINGRIRRRLNILPKVSINGTRE